MTEEQPHATLRDVYEEAIQNIDNSLSQCTNAQQIARVGARSYENMLEQLADAAEGRKQAGNGDVPPHLIKILLTIARVGYIHCAIYHMDNYDPPAWLVEDLWGRPPEKLRHQQKMANSLLPMLFMVEEKTHNQEENSEC